MNQTVLSGIELSKKIWANVPGADANGYSNPGDTIAYAFGVVDAKLDFGDILGPDGYVIESKLIGGVITLIGANTVTRQLPPGDYQLFEFVIARDADGVTLRYGRRTGSDFTAAINGVRKSPDNDEDGGIGFTVSASGGIVPVVCINKSVSVLIDKHVGDSSPSERKGVLFFGTSSYLGLTQDGYNWNSTSIVRLGLTDANGALRLDGFTSGNNVFLHEVVPKAAYDAGLRPKQMTVYKLDGSVWYTAGFPDFHQVTRDELDTLLKDPKVTPVGRELIRANLNVGDYLFTNQNYFYERQGVIPVTVLNERLPKGGIELSKKIWAHVPGSDSKGRSNPDNTIQYAFGVANASAHFADIARADGYVDPSKLIGGVLMVTGASKATLQLAPGSYKLFEFTIVRDADGATLLFGKRTGWDFTADFDGVLQTPSDDGDGAIVFEVSNQTRVISVVAVNKSLSVQIRNQVSDVRQTGQTTGRMFFGTSSYLGLTQDSQNWNGGAIVRLGVTDAEGILRLDGFVSGNNVFIHEVIPKDTYDAGVRPKEMTVRKLDGSVWFTTPFSAQHQVTQDELDMLLKDPKFTGEGRQLIRAHLKVGDYLFSARDYFYERQGVIDVSVLNDFSNVGK
ncbi:hypothetical protein [Paraburkholderia sp.]|uniref:hypothetical protein n=1 Tax=Paraburkholderia sp. TaxID=1926495 RepID=UPI002384D309|nr:hypothetical protein [Paraburkholderia sp.]MDE1181297.1 hypothetical protein [Paraburkholderia sp.]